MGKIIYTGTVISDKMQKTRIVKTMRVSKHPKYGKVVKRLNKFKVHDENNSTKTGDIVCIQETRPLSKEKRFRVVKIIKKIELPDVVIKEEKI